MNLGPVKEIVFITYHHYLSKRKAGFHWIADSAIRLGHKVTFVTAPLSPFTYLHNDHRLSLVKICDLNKPVKVNDQLTIYSYLSLFSPLPGTGIRSIDEILSIFPRLYQKAIPESLKEIVKNTDLIIFESTAAIVLFDPISKVASDATFIYRVSDPLETSHVIPYIKEYERSIIPRFNLISVPEQVTYDSYAPYGRVILQPHGLNIDAFSKETKKPECYDRFERNLIFVGNSYLDVEFLTVASDLFPRYGFHVIGPFHDLIPKKNLLVYGEMPFDQTIPYIKWADVGLQNRDKSLILRSVSNSLKMLQYTWCRLPIIAPYGLDSKRNNVFYYDFGDKRSIQASIDQALIFDRAKTYVGDVMTWDDLTNNLINEV